MLWCLIFHSAELQNYVPALHGIMFGSFNLCWEYFTYNQAGSFFEFSPILFGSSELCSERGYSNYVRQVDWQPRDKKFTRSPGARNICLTNLFSCRLIWFAITLTEKRGNFPQKFNCFSTFAFVSIFLVFVAIASSTFVVRHVRQNSTRTLVIIRINYRERGKCFSPRDSS